ncbi:hypothetical protein CHLRE_43g760597v5 [Chlamydomonas reinhardtii]|uniref:Uncharacterized protein n=1 Tax=Chlamydomonas reinhardtii TaxID=3055 RepID=A0A2K3CMU2_CHLRE|nr:uncharacterized protein CHLRE_43g760597v5 [Chlamydomonas reinhardtii]PNW69594.1 hypothetical protein CHLRE_43g760597v5 [Chlamydomonas reinhardtii]
MWEAPGFDYWARLVRLLRAGGIDPPDEARIALIARHLSSRMLAAHTVAAARELYEDGLYLPPPPYPSFQQLMSKHAGLTLAGPAFPDVHLRLPYMRHRNDSGGGGGGGTGGLCRLLTATCSTSGRPMLVKLLQPPPPPPTAAEAAAAEGSGVNGRGGHYSCW